MSHPVASITFTVAHVRNPSVSAEIDRFVRTHPLGLPLHLTGWLDVMRQTYGYQTFRLVARSGNDIVGLLSLYHVNSPLTGNRLSSLPGGMLTQDAAVGQALVEHASALATELGAKKVHLRDQRQTWSTAGHITENHVHWLKQTCAGSDSLWTTLHRDLRRQVRKARKNGLHVSSEPSREQLDAFYSHFAHFCHAIGTPIFPQTFLTNVCTQFPDEHNIVVVYQEQRPIAGYFQLLMGDTVYGMWGASLRETIKLKAAHLGIWEVIRFAADNGYRTLDMGRSPAQSTASEFKGQWCDQFRPIFQQTIRPDGDQANAAAIHDSKSGQLLQRWWPKLPRNVANRLGPKLRYHVPFG